jgi:2'-5' RNA ligase
MDSDHRSGYNCPRCRWAKGRGTVDEAFEKVRYILLVRLPRTTEIRIEDAYLALLGTTKPVMGFHLTLLGPFLLPSEASSSFLFGINAVCQRWQPFKLRIMGLGAFRTPDDNVIYLDVVDPGRIVALHDSLLAATAGQILPQSERHREWSFDRYHAHVTLGLRLSDRELARLWPIAEEHPIDESFEVSRIWLAEESPHGAWRYVAEYLFGTSDPSDPLTTHD